MPSDPSHTRKLGDVFVGEKPFLEARIDRSDCGKRQRAVTALPKISGQLVHGPVESAVQILGVHGQQVATVRFSGLVARSQQIDDLLIYLLGKHNDGPRCRQERGNPLL
jgi:hypothetical protein